MNDFLVSEIRVTTHEHGDDLLSAGLGLSGLRASIPPMFAIPEAPTAAEVRRRAIWSNWRGIADLSPSGGFADVYGALPTVTGREFHAFARVPGAVHPHRVLTQIPDSFNRQARCVVVAASSGSRGVYGAIALAGGWGLPHQCAVAYTDKGTGTGYFDIDSSTGVKLDGTRGHVGDSLEFAPDTAAAPVHGIATKHAHSGDNPEADWGLHVLQAARFALRSLDQAWPLDAPFTFANTRVIALGVSNGAGAALRAAGLDKAHELAGVVAVSPNVFVGDSTRPMYDYATEAAIFQPCALLHPTFDTTAFARLQAAKPPGWVSRCGALHERGLLSASDSSAQAQEAYDRLRAHGWSDSALAAAALSTSFDLWRTLAVTYASSYMRASIAAMPCGFHFAAQDATQASRSSTLSERAAWAADGSGIPPSPGIAIIDSRATGIDPTLPALLALRALWDSQTLLTNVAATRAAVPRADLPVIVMHGDDDGLIPQFFSSDAYVQSVQQQDDGRNLRYWRVANAQHFDAFLGMPLLAARYVPMMPYAYAAMDLLSSHLTQDAPLPPSSDIVTRPRGFDGAGAAPLRSANLGIIPH